MNRHIIGLTVFLVIVKSTFLLYWAFFAPVNFFTQAPSLAVQSSGFNLTDKSYGVEKPKLQNVVINIEQGKITADAFICDAKSSELSPELDKIRVNIFNNDLHLIWSGNLTQKARHGCKGADFEVVAPKLKKLNSRVSYYATLDDSVYELRQTLPVLIDAGK